jgi:formylglycine-generating enzyme required for sulfatase activity
MAVRSYPPNGYGLYEATGNVWEWCADADPDGRRPLRGGSFLCDEHYCSRYRVDGRIANPPDTTTNHIGFRMAGPAAEG